MSEPVRLSGPAIRHTMRDLAVESTPEREGILSESLGRQTALAAGSSEALRRTLLPQITALRQRLEAAFSALDKRLGPNAGAQLQRGRAGLLTESGAQLQQLFAGGQQQGVASLLSLLQGFRPAQLAQMPATPTQQHAFDPSAFSALGQSAAGLVDTWMDMPKT